MMHSAATPERVADAGPVSPVANPPIMTRKVWLPRLVYDCLPYFYLSAGFAALFATLYISEWFWVVPHYLLFSAACIHLGVRVYRQRHKRGRTDNPQTGR
jgi:hypothetical protein